MALITSAASGNFNATATWTGGVVPGVGDEARASTGHTVTITANATCDEISNAGTGKFVINDGVTVTANVTAKSTTNDGICVDFTATSPASCNIVGDCQGGPSQRASAVRLNSSGTINITGNCYGPTVTTNSIAGGILNNSTGIINITGNCYGANTNNNNGAANNSTGTINIIGGCFGGGGASSNGAINSSTGILSVIGTITASSQNAGVVSSNVLATNIFSGPFVCETSRSVSPILCAAWRWNASPSNSTYLEVMTNTLGTKRTLYTADNITGMPVASDVKIGVTYGPVGELTGTMGYTLSPSVAEIQAAVWSAATKEITGGTVTNLTNAPASVTPADIWSYGTRTITGGTVDTLVNAPSVPSASAIADEVRLELAPELSNLDAPVSGATAPSASTVATAVRSELSVELSNLDAPVSGATAPDAASVATAVRSELSSELAKVSALNTERLAQCSTVATTGAQIAAALS